MWALAEHADARKEYRYLYTQSADGSWRYRFVRAANHLCTPLPAGRRLCVAYRDNRVGGVADTAAEKSRYPSVKASFLVMQSEPKGILLEQRPPSGIWGGLLCLPELPAGADAAHYAQQHYGVTAKQWQELPSLRHAFTHFRLTLRPLSCDRETGASLQWRAITAGWLRKLMPMRRLPTPIRTLARACAWRIARDFVDFRARPDVACLDPSMARRMFGRPRPVYRWFDVSPSLADDRLYLQGRYRSHSHAFTAKSCCHHSPICVKGKQAVSLGYFEAPPEVFDDKAEMLEWARLAHAAAYAAARRNRPTKKSRPQFRKLTVSVIGALGRESCS